MEIPLLYIGGALASMMIGGFGGGLTIALDTSWRGLAAATFQAFAGSVLAMSLLILGSLQ